MKKRIVVVFLFLIALTVFQGCTQLKGSGTTSSTSSENSSTSSIQQSTSTIINAGSNEMNSTSSTPQSTSSKMDTAYEPLAMTDDGTIEPNSDMPSFLLPDIIILLQAKAIPIVEIKGASKILSGSGVDYYNTNWDYSFFEQMDSPYDVNALGDLIQKQAIAAIYVKTPYEIYCFIQSESSIDPEAIVPIEEFFSSVMIITNPRFVTKKGIKIGDSFEKAEKAYGFSNDYIIKNSDSDWSWHAIFPDYIIIFDGTKDGITSITLGRKPESAD